MPVTTEKDGRAAVVMLSALGVKDNVLGEALTERLTVPVAARVVALPE
jgi:hypothetical protein